MCERAGEDSRHGACHVDIQVGMHVFYLNVRVFHCMST